MNGGRVATVVLGAGAAAMLLVMVAPAALQRVQDRMDHTARYPSGAAAKADHDGPAPGWLPDSATGVVLLGADRQGDRLIRATLPDRALPAGCTSGSPLGGVHLRARWFPADAPQRATAHCGLYDVALIGDQLYGWQDAAVVAAGRSAAPVAR
ncbi:hypothetical protein HUT16_29280 [Kitasatospora sp. NA04385]|uniref:hypothetical protein n=1 Tax=Kitasatospora sp. NA04385 TaxID=2742135 RepID=UPI0015922D78|nr:hypothetical protein [Kitasatospora sp. NA04385]QKW22637.1 hypothetical protein HUT16_29280 [Kitasatospora sp. NA04385]